jgi:pimeloyl-ACP methyl ester carboxylesterase
VKKVCCHHGSPGTTSDFREIEAGVAKAGVQLLPVERKNALVGVPGVPGVPGFQLGYSWGANLALSASFGREKCEGIILISPYFAAPKKHGAFYFPLLRLILGVGPLRRKIVNSFIAKTASPASVPASYNELKAALGSRLFAAVKEKSDFIDSAERLLERSAALPLLVIMGENDAVSNADETQQLVQKYSPNADVIVLKNAGHALLWTHPQEVVSAIVKFVEKYSEGER